MITTESYPIRYGGQVINEPQFEIPYFSIAIILGLGGYSIIKCFKRLRSIKPSKPQNQAIGVEVKSLLSFQSRGNLESQST